MNSYANIDLIELILLVRKRDDAAFSELVSRYGPLINSISSGFVSPTFSYDEAFSDSCVALHRAAMSYDLEQTEVTFGLYARICIYRRLCDGAVRISRHDIINADDVDVDSFSDGTNIESHIVGRERMREYLDKVRLLLSDYEYRVFLLYIEGESTASIAEKLGKTSKSVDNAKARMFKHLRRESALFSDV